MSSTPSAPSPSAMPWTSPWRRPRRDWGGPAASAGGRATEGVAGAVAAGAVMAGRPEGQDFRCIPDRREAIREIIGRARPGDTVLLAGKGHEDPLLVRSPAPPGGER